MPTCTVEEALQDLKDGKMIILVDDEDRENEGDLTMAAEFITPDAINFMAKYGRGLVCLALAPDIADRLDLQPMVRDNTSKFGTGFTVSIEAKKGVTTGISAADRAVTIRTAIAPDSKASDLARAMSFLYAPNRAGCSSGQARPKVRLICAGWPD